jgi:polyisoprenoid-binding protein YceI
MSSTATAQGVHYDIDTAHSSVHFSIRHLMIANIRGTFNKVSGSVTYDPANPGASSVEVAVDVDSVNTRDPKRDGHLKTPDFFDVANHPTITFKSKRISSTGGSYYVIGDLTIKGNTKEITLHVDAVSDEMKDPWGNMRRGAAATTTINRKDFGLVFHAPLEGGGVMLGDDVLLHIDVEMVRKP